MYADINIKAYKTESILPPNKDERMIDFARCPTRIIDTLPNATCTIMIKIPEK